MDFIPTLLLLAPLLLMAAFVAWGMARCLFRTLTRTLKGVVSCPFMLDFLKDVFLSVAQLGGALGGVLGLVETEPAFFALAVAWAVSWSLLALATVLRLRSLEQKSVPRPRKAKGRRKG